MDGWDLGYPRSNTHTRISMTYHISEACLNSMVNGKCQWHLKLQETYQKKLKPLITSRRHFLKEI